MTNKPLGPVQVSLSAAALSSFPSLLLSSPQKALRMGHFSQAQALPYSFPMGIATEGEGRTLRGLRGNTLPSSSPLKACYSTLELELEFHTEFDSKKSA